MQAYLPRIVVLLITFALGVGLTMTGRYVQRGGAAGADIEDQKPFVFAVRRRADSSGPANTCP